MTTVRQIHTARRLLCCHLPSPLRCPGIILRVAAPWPISTLQSRPPLRIACTSRLAAVSAAAPRSFARHSSTGSVPPGASFVKNPSISEDQDTLQTPATPPPTPPRLQASPQQEQVYKQPSYELTFTCKPCGHRSSHTVTKQAYHYGTTLIRCPGCKDRHVISDHLKIFNEKPMSFVDILEGKGQRIQKGIRTEEDTIEFLE
ncbi:DNL zinc finger domain-containing protein [Tirmania nivea]|nr:DNL zinc finger domain-containing protein [Tirmania nivea]